ncbi:MAG: hypothetical protein HY817_02130 [Candidatus Abawacabacteria bacterium]|nr:hypothetical protein [Candidatus Abawacabacteria bacterium]
MCRSVEGISTLSSGSAAPVRRAAIQALSFEPRALRALPEPPQNQVPAEASPLPLTTAPTGMNKSVALDTSTPQIIAEPEQPKIDSPKVKIVGTPITEGQVLAVTKGSSALSKSKRKKLAKTASKQAATERSPAVSPTPSAPAIVSSETHPRSTSPVTYYARPSAPSVVSRPNTPLKPQAAVVAAVVAAAAALEAQRADALRKQTETEQSIREQTLRQVMAVLGIARQLENNMIKPAENAPPRDKRAFHQRLEDAKGRTIINIARALGISSFPLTTGGALVQKANIVRRLDGLGISNEDRPVFLKS